MSTPRREAPRSMGTPMMRTEVMRGAYLPGSDPAGRRMGMQGMRPLCTPPRISHHQPGRHDRHRADDVVPEERDARILPVDEPDRRHADDQSIEGAGGARPRDHREEED